MSSTREEHSDAQEELERLQCYYEDLEMECSELDYEDEEDD